MRRCVRCMMVALLVVPVGACSAPAPTTGVRVVAEAHPAKDSDSDGVPDDKDKCPREREDGLPPAVADSCRSNDPDGDGILGEADKCPLEAETKNGVEDDDGCP